MVDTSGIIIIASFFSLVTGIMLGYWISQLFEIEKDRKKHMLEMLKYEIISDVIDQIEKKGH